MIIKKIIKGGKRITAGLLFIGIGAAPFVVPLVAPEYTAIVPEAQAIAGVVGATLVGNSKWNAMKAGKKNND